MSIETREVLARVLLGTYYDMDDLFYDLIECALGRIEDDVWDLDLKQYTRERLMGVFEECKADLRDSLKRRIVVVESEVQE